MTLNIINKPQVFQLGNSQDLSWDSSLPIIMLTKVTLKGFMGRSDMEPSETDVFLIFQLSLLMFSIFCIMK